MRLHDTASHISARAPTQQPTRQCCSTAVTHGAGKGRKSSTHYYYSFHVHALLGNVQLDGVVGVHAAWCNVRDALELNTVCVPNPGKS